MALTKPTSNMISSVSASVLSGTVPTANLGSGTANSTTFLRGDGTWNAPAGGGGLDAIISTQTPSSASTVDFTTGINSTYKIYELEFIDMRSSVDQGSLNVQFSTDGGSTWTTVRWSGVVQSYDGSNTQRNDYFSSSDMMMTHSGGSGYAGFSTTANYSLSGRMTLINPAGTSVYKATYGEMFGTGQVVTASTNTYMIIRSGGSLTTTSAINAIRVKGGSGTISGTIILRGRG